MSTIEKRLRRLELVRATPEDLALARMTEAELDAAIEAEGLLIGEEEFRRIEAEFIASQSG